MQLRVRRHRPDDGRHDARRIRLGMSRLRPIGGGFEIRRACPDRRNPAPTARASARASARPPTTSTPACPARGRARFLPRRRESNRRSLRSAAAAQSSGGSWKPCQSGAFTRQLLSSANTFPSASSHWKVSLNFFTATLIPDRRQIEPRMRRFDLPGFSALFDDRPVLRRLRERQQLKRRRIDELPAIHIPTNDPRISSARDSRFAALQHSPKNIPRRKRRRFICDIPLLAGQMRNGYRIRVVSAPISVL